MICNNCKNRVYSLSIAKTLCRICGDEITTNHMPGFKVCLQCSEEKKLCAQCGRQIDLDD